MLNDERVGFPGGSVIKNLPVHKEATRDMGFSLDREDPLEEDMTMDSSTLAWEIPWTEEPARYSPWGRRELDLTEVT